MTTRKRNEYLDGDLSEDEAGSGYDSEAAQEAKGGKPTSSSAKKRKLDTSASEAESEFSSFTSEPGSTTEPQTHTPTTKKQATPASPLQSPQSSKPARRPHNTKAPTPKLPTPGVIYLSRIPPYMRPSLVRTLLTPHGRITNLFLTPEPPSQYLARKKHGGNKKPSYVDGWIEFSRRKDARLCVEAINGNIVGGKKGGWYRDDVWNARYLKGFSWGDLMEGVRREEREREEKVRQGLRREGRERGTFLEGVERAKAEEGKRRKREAKEGRGDGVDPGARAGVSHEADDGGKDGKPRERFERRFRQNEVEGKRKKQEQSEDVKRVLGKIF